MPAQKNPNLTNAKRHTSWVKVPSGGPQLPNGSSAKQGKPADEGNDILDLDLDELSALLEPVCISGCGGKSDPM